ncbi:hypothetical protein Bca4012_071968 [Brassica carinata]
MGATEAFGKSLKTWKSWVLEKLDLDKTYVFLRNALQKWDMESGGLCDVETGPETDKRRMEPDAAHNRYIYEVIEDMDINTRHRVQERWSSFSVPRGGTPVDAPQDCIHWCLPGVPDTWNEILYAKFLSMNYGNIEYAG